MRKNVIKLASSAAVALLALTALQGCAQAYQYRNDATRVDQRGHDHDRYHFRYFSHNRNHHDHDRR